MFQHIKLIYEQQNITNCKITYFKPKITPASFVSRIFDRIVDTDINH